MTAEINFDYKATDHCEEYHLWMLDHGTIAYWIQKLKQNILYLLSQSDWFGKKDKNNFANANKRIIALLFFKRSLQPP